MLIQYVLNLFSIFISYLEAIAITYKTMSDELNNPAVAKSTSHVPFWYVMWRRLDEDKLSKYAKSLIRLSL